MPIIQFNGEAVFCLLGGFVYAPCKSTGEITKSETGINVYRMGFKFYLFILLASPFLFLKIDEQKNTMILSQYYHNYIIIGQSLQSN